MRENILNIIYNNLEKISNRRFDNLSEDTFIEELGIDSIEYVKLIVSIEEQEHISFDECDLIGDKFKTIRDLVDRIIEILG